MLEHAVGVGGGLEGEVVGGEGVDTERVVVDKERQQVVDEIRRTL